MIVADITGLVVFENYFIQPNYETEGWDGRIGGVVVKGIYDFEVTLQSIWCVGKTRNGKICNFPYDMPENFATKEAVGNKCVFGAYHKGS